jgi:Zn-dependent M16 (insulinase) family peptidase
MLTQAKDDWPTLLGRLEKVRETVLSQEGLIINLTADPDALDAVRPTVDAFAAKLPKTAKADPTAVPWRKAVTLLPAVDEAYAITTQVHYVAAGMRLFEPGTKLDGAFYAVARFLSRGYLWDNVRVVGGAYGGGCSLNPRTGGFAFSSYRDPNVQGTLDIYAKTAEALENAHLTDDALEQAIVGAVGDLDSPMTSEQKGFRALTLHLTGVTTEMRQQYRDEVLGTTRASFKAFAKTLRAKPFKVAIFGAKDAIEAANTARGADEQIAITQLS